jgi:hypothetical protein
MPHDWNEVRRMVQVAATCVALFATASVRAQCPGDLTGNGAVDGADLGALLTVWGAPGGSADVTGDGIVNGSDLGMLLVNWGAMHRGAALGHADRGAA